MFFINYYFADSCLLRQGKQNTKVNKWNCIKLKFFYIVKEFFNKKKWQSIEWEKIFSNDIFDRKFIPKIYKDSTQLNIKKTNNPIKKWAEGLNRLFFFHKEDIHIAKRPVKRCSIFLIKERQIKTTMKYYLTAVRIAILEKTTHNKCQ